MVNIKKFSFYLYIALLFHLAGFIILMPDNTSSALRKLISKVVKASKTARTPRVTDIILENEQHTNVRPDKFTPFVSESFNPSSGRLTEERGYNVTTPPSPSRENSMRRDTNTQRQRVLPRDANMPDILLRPMPSESRTLLNVPRLKTKNHSRFVLNFDSAGTPAFNTRAFPNVKYFINVAKTSWQYLQTFAPIHSVAMGAMKNSAVLLAFTIDRTGKVQKVWIQDTTESPTLEALSKRAIEYIKDGTPGFGSQPNNYDIKVVYIYFYVGRDFSTFRDESSPIAVRYKAVFYFEYKKLK
jgi:hypothetical protein